MSRTVFHEKREGIYSLLQILTTILGFLPIFQMMKGLGTPPPPVIYYSTNCYRKNGKQSKRCKRQMTHQSQADLVNYRVTNSIPRGVYSSGIDKKIEPFLKNRGKVIYG